MGTPLPQQIALVDNGIPGKTMKLRIQNPPPNLGIKTEISRLLSIPDHQEGIRCKAPRSDD